MLGWGLLCHLHAQHAACLGKKLQLTGKSVRQIPPRVLQNVRPLLKGQQSLTPPFHLGPLEFSLAQYT